LPPAEREAPGPRRWIRWGFGALAAVLAAATLSFVVLAVLVGWTGPQSVLLGVLATLALPVAAFTTYLSVVPKARQDPPK
jgi:hypothetical protein